MLIIAGTFELDPGQRSDFMDQAKSMILATRKEEGCSTYSFTEDPYDAGIVRVFEVWESQDNLKDHIASEHSQFWNQNVLTKFETKNDVHKYAISKVSGIEDWD